MCICTLKKQKQKKSSRATPSNVPKLGVSGVKDAAKTIKDLGILDYCILSWGSQIDKIRLLQKKRLLEI